MGTQYWYWFPLSHFLALAFTPSCVIALNSELDMPVLQYRSNAKPSTYAYPALEETKKESKEKVATAVLSITAKQKTKEAEKNKKDGGEAKEEKMDVDDDKKEKKKDEGEKKKEAAADSKADVKKTDKDEKETKDGK